MPVYDYTYKTWEGQRRGAMFRWLAIPKFTYLDFLGKKLFIWAFMLGWLQFLLRLAYIYLKVNEELLFFIRIPPNVLPDIDAFYYMNMIVLQMPLCFYFSFLMGSGLISNDLKHNALVLYCSKPISRWEYFVGKFSALFLLLIMLTGLQTLLVHALQVAVLPGNETGLEYWWKHAWLAGAIIIFSTIVSASLTLMILAASSLTKNKNYAATTFVVYIIGAIIVAGLLYELLDGNSAMFGFSPFHSAAQIGRQLFQMDKRNDIMPNWAAWCGIGGLWLLCAGILYRQLKRASRFTN